MNTDMMTELSFEEMETVVGGHELEEKFADAALYRAGVSFVNCLFGEDEFYVGSTRISKSLAKALRARSSALWSASYAESGDMVGYLREWKSILANEYGLSWNGQLGTYDWSWT